MNAKNIIGAALVAAPFAAALGYGAYVIGPMILAVAAVAIAATASITAGIFMIGRVK